MNGWVYGHEEMELNGQIDRWWERGKKGGWDGFEWMEWVDQREKDWEDKLDGIGGWMVGRKKKDREEGMEWDEMSGWWERGKE